MTVLLPISLGAQSLSTASDFVSSPDDGESESSGSMGFFYMHVKPSTAYALGGEYTLTPGTCPQSTLGAGGGG